MAYEGKNVETIALHTGWRSDETTGSVAVPIHQLQVFNLIILSTQQVYLRWLN
mgnify:CR=1 FL=1